MSELDQIIKRLRELVDERHRVAREAINTLVDAFAGPDVPSVPSVIGSSPYRLEHHDNGQPTVPVPVIGGSNVERVIGCLTDAPKTVDQISEETGLQPSQVRGVLYSIHDSVRSRFKSVKLGTRMRYQRTHQAG